MGLLTSVVVSESQDFYLFAYCSLVCSVESLVVFVGVVVAWVQSGMSVGWWYQFPVLVEGECVGDMVRVGVMGVGG